MINLADLVGELAEKLPKAGWPIRNTLRIFDRPQCKMASIIWGDGENFSRTKNGKEIGLQLYEREIKPILIIVESQYSCSIVDPDNLDGDGIVNALSEYKWVVGDNFS